VALFLNQQRDDVVDSIPVLGRVGQRYDRVQLNAKDFRDLLALSPEGLHEALNTIMLGFRPSSIDPIR
jgi:hypothetical protein